MTYKENGSRPDLLSVLNRRSFLLPQAIGEIAEEQAVLVANQEITRPDFDRGKCRGKVLAELLVRLKKQGNGVISDYELAVFQTMHSLDPENMERFFPTAESFLNLQKIDYSNFPRGFPHLLRAKTEMFLRKELESNLDDDDDLEFLIRQYLGKISQKIEADLDFFNGRNGPELASLFFELRTLAVAPTLNERALKSEIREAGNQKQRVLLVHIKSLRYTYPEGKKLAVLDHLEEVVSPGIGSELRSYPSERVIFARLGKIVNLFEHYGVKTELLVLVADNDLEILFPSGNSLISLAEIGEAKEAAQRYIRRLQADYSDPNEEVYLLTDFLADFGLAKKYEAIRKKIFYDARGDGGGLVKESVVEARAAYQLEHYQNMFGPKYTYTEARLTACHQIANLMALSVVFKNLPGVPIVVIDDRGQENHLVGGYEPNSATIIFTQLKDKPIVRK